MTVNPRHLRHSIAAFAHTALVLACAASPLAGTVHYALTPHEVCAEHGEVVHGGPAHTRASAASPADIDAAPSIRGDAPANLHFEHAHCSVASTQRERGIVPAPGDALAPAAGTGTTRPLALPQAPVPSIALLALAPKLPPPA